MADMEVEEGSSRHKGTRGKKLSTRVDMTPMCDVGFLLITFFMLTTTLQRQKTMNLFLPHDVKDQKDQNKVKESQALTLLLGKDNKLFYYEGIGTDAAKDPQNAIKKSSYSLKDGIGKVIFDKSQSVVQNSGGRDSIVIIIKPMKESTYENVVSVLDDMNIYEINKYALVKFTKNDKKMIDMKEGGGGTAASGQSSGTK